MATKNLMLLTATLALVVSLSFALEQINSNDAEGSRKCTRINIETFGRQVCVTCCARVGFEVSLMMQDDCRCSTMSNQLEEKRKALATWMGMLIDLDGLDELIRPELTEAERQMHDWAA